MRKPLAVTITAAALAGPALVLPSASLAAPAAEASAEPNIVQIAASDRRFDTLVSLVKRARLADDLSGDAKLTVFAPTDAAFRKVPRATLRKLGRNRALLRRVLLYHVVAGDVKAAQVVQLRSAKTLEGSRVRIRVSGERVLLDRRSRVVQADVAASNGTIHVINRVLTP